MPLRRGRLPLLIRLLPWLPLLGLAGCSGTPFGDQLSRSFSAPPPASSSAPSASKTTAAAPAVKATAAATKAPADREAEPAKVSAATAARSSRPAPLPPAAPAPYRVTIKLPAADPSAPAERVTEALRAAGVAFEVETIERVKAGGDGSGAPQRTPAPPLR